MMQKAIAKLIEGTGLTRMEAHRTMAAIMSGQATPSQIAGFLVALRTKGETVAEIAGCALAMREAATRVVFHTDDVVDNCGTGGDGQNSLNISTGAAFVAAGAGCHVAKHGNRSVSSKCGSADVLEAMGIRIDPLPAIVERSVNEAGIGFMFAPNFHPAMKHAMPTRRELGIRTVFNMLGPLTNPARARVQLIGVYHPHLTRVLPKVLMAMGHKAGFVVHADGWDEILLDAPTQVSALFGKRIRAFKLTAKDFGLPKVPRRLLKGGTAAQNARMIRRILKGERLPARHVMVANAAALIYLSERAYRKNAISLKDAARLAERAIDGGEAFRRYEKMAAISTMVA